MRMQQHECTPVVACWLPMCIPQRISRCTPALSGMNGRKLHLCTPWCSRAHLQRRAHFSALKVSKGAVEALVDDVPRHSGYDERLYAAVVAHGAALRAALLPAAARMAVWFPVPLLPPREPLSRSCGCDAKQVLLPRVLRCVTTG